MLFGRKDVAFSFTATTRSALALAPLPDDCAFLVDGSSTFGADPFRLADYRQFRFPFAVDFRASAGVINCARRIHGAYLAH